VIQATWRGTRVTQFGYLETSSHAQERLRAQQKAEALTALKSILPASEYDAMAAQIQNGEREVRLENGFILTSVSPR
jgi:hypothetical protein